MSLLDNTIFLYLNLLLLLQYYLCPLSSIRLLILALEREVSGPARARAVDSEGPPG
jgi:hypothetical protein